MKHKNSKAATESKKDPKNIQSGLPSSGEAHQSTISDMLEKIAIPTPNLIGFQAIRHLEVDEATSNAWLSIAFALRLGDLVSIQKLDVDGLGETFAICFPSDKWTTDSKGELVRKAA